MKTRKFATVFILGILLSACSQPEIFSEFRPLPNAEWDKRQAVLFEVPIRDASVPYQIRIQLRNNDQYPFRNIWLFVEYKTPDGKTRTDTLHTDLADAYGKWYGSGLSLHTYSFPYQLHVQYPDTGTYTYLFLQGMRADRLKGITDIGLEVSKE
jgi:gliding motility-associated lipoprotein GldH